MSDDLIQAAATAAAKAYAPYSNYHVGAAIRAPSGEIYAGCNIENAAYPQGWCAEPSALSARPVGYQLVGIEPSSSSVSAA